ncbi:MAG: phosphorybosylanthranilate isomerase, partial [Oligoflexia bacterium]|nr:phosphorybosylanthranilate isomerase [Oligoflexia bacterium]
MQLIGVIHLLPLPAGPAPSPGLADVAQRALQDAQALIDGGVHVAVIENLGDAPFRAGPV